MSFMHRLPRRRLATLGELSPTLAEDVAALDELAEYCLRADTGGVIHRELANAFVPDRDRLQRLRRAGLLHDVEDAAACPCGVRAVDGYWSLHFEVMTAIHRSL